MKSQWTFRRQLITLGSVLLVVLYAEILYFTDFHPGTYGLLLPIGFVALMFVLLPLIPLGWVAGSYLIRATVVVVCGMYLAVRRVFKGMRRASGQVERRPANDERSAKAERCERRGTTILVLYDDLAIGAFGSPEAALNNLEAIDVMNNEYSFCDDAGQRYVAAVTRPGGWLRQDEVALRPEGKPDIANALALLDRAVKVEQNKLFASIEDLRRHLALRQQNGRDRRLSKPAELPPPTR